MSCRSGGAKVHEKALEKADLNHLSLHDLRRTYASLADIAPDKEVILRLNKHDYLKAAQEVVSIIKIIIERQSNGRIMPDEIINMLAVISDDSYARNDIHRAVASGLLKLRHMKHGLLYKPGDDPYTKIGMPALLNLGDLYTTHDAVNAWFRKSEQKIQFVDWQFVSLENNQLPHRTGQVKITEQRKDAILSGLQNMSYIPNKLPKRQNGKSWVKAEFWAKYGAGKKHQIYVYCSLLKSI